MKLLTLAAAVLMSVTSAAQMDAGDVAPQFEGKWFNHKATTLADLQGHVVFLDVWRTWCGPCNAMIPHLNEMHEEYADQGLKVVGITTEGKSLVTKHIEKFKMAFPIASVAQKEESNYGIRGFPTSFLIDPDGVIVWRGHPAAFEREFGTDKLEALLATTDALPDVSGQYSRVAKHLDKKDLGKAWLEIEKELEGGKSAELVGLQERLQLMVNAKLKKAEECCDGEMHGEAVAILEGIVDMFEGIPAAQEAAAQLEEIQADDAAHDDIEAHAKYVKAMGYWRDGKFDKAIKSLNGIVRKYPDTATAGRADAILERHDA